MKDTFLIIFFHKIFEISKFLEINTFIILFIIYRRDWRTTLLPYITDGKLIFFVLDNIRLNLNS